MLAYLLPLLSPIVAAFFPKNKGREQEFFCQEWQVVHKIFYAAEVKVVQEEKRSEKKADKVRK